ncbi:MAG: 4Fe-4S dicluster domain-containing protein [Planctomycetes bacterium]|nr:4Fe-4S dicluster domain-containing protein [Planctomycetota bacterium]
MTPAPVSESPLPQEELTREIFGNISPASKLVFYVLAVVSLAVCAYGVWQRVRLWKLGRANPARSGMATALLQFMARVVTQRTVRGRGVASLAHALLFFGFCLLALGSVLVAIEHYAHDLSGRGATDPVFHFGTYYAVFEVTLELAGLALLVGACWFLARRIRSDTSIGHTAADSVILGTLIFLALTGYATEGLRILREDTHQPGFSFVGLLFAKALRGCGIGGTETGPVHLVTWWVHAVGALAFVAALPYTRLLHVVAGGLSVATQEKRLGHLEPVSAEEVEETGRFGVGRVQDFSRRQLLELDACVSCGRCQDVCPAHAAGKPLSPRDIVQDARGALNIVGPLLRAARTAGTDEDDATSEMPQLHGDAVSAEALWACTTCNACNDVCPLGVSPVAMITDMRRHLIGVGELRGAPARSLEKTQRQGNPWGLPKEDRMAWARDLDVPLVTDNPDFDILYWVGCAAAYDAHAQKTARAVVQLLQHAGVNFAVLGSEERCLGECARRMGDEFVFTELAEHNVGTLSSHDVKRIVTHCPHCLNSLRQDYPEVGGNYQVLHHTALLAELQAAGKLPTQDTVNGAVTFHDPCYLGRVQGETEAPRSVLRTMLPDAGALQEPVRRGKETACCGAGGGRMWFDDEAETRVGRDRIDELIGTGAETVVTGCPFCLRMVTDGVAERDDGPAVKDVAELLLEMVRVAREDT